MVSHAVIHKGKGGSGGGRGERLEWKKNGTEEKVKWNTLVLIYRLSRDNDPYNKIIIPHILKVNSIPSS